jgi:DNA repair protein RecO (recombination protein O)
MLHKAKAIVLHNIKYGESGIITHVYTNTHGRQSILVQGVRKKNSRVSANLFQPLSLLIIDAYIKENREIQRIKEVKPFCILNNLYLDIRRSTIAIFISELLYRTLLEAEPNPPLFDFLFNTIQILDVLEEGLENFHLIFLIQFTKFLGIYPGVNSDLDQFQKNKGISIIGLLDYSLSDSGKLNMDSLTRAQTLKQLVSYYEDHLEGMGQIRSLKILQEVFHY